MIIGGDFGFRESLIEDIQSVDLIQALPTVCLDFVSKKELHRHTAPRLLIRFEGPSSSPRSHAEKYEQAFTKIVDVGTSIESPWPIDPVFLSRPKSRSKRESSGVMVLANKISFSGSELYSIRRDLMACHHPYLRIYGTGWNAPIMAKLTQLAKAFAIQAHVGKVNLRGMRGWFSSLSKENREVEDKFEIQSRSTVAVVVENDLQKTTEKVFEALGSGCEVIYVGPDLSYLDPLILRRVHSVSPSARAILSKLDELLAKKYLPPTQSQLKALSRHVISSRGKLFTLIHKEVLELCP